MYGHGESHMHCCGCNGRCVAGVIIAIIFGALFLWTLVQGFVFQTAGAPMATAFGYYLIALIFVVVAKWAKMWAHACGCKCNADVSKPIAPKSFAPKKKK
ncbi:MAG: hypothetical protein ABIJ92_05420 [Candidatus Aenigmatarchaeota archaeon]